MSLDFLEYRTSGPTLSKNKDRIPFQCDSSGRLLTSSLGGGGSSGPTTTITGFSNVIPELQYLSSRPTLTNSQFTNAFCDSSGALLVNPGIYNAAPTHTSISVATTQAQVIAANAARTYLLIQNQDATNPIWIRFGSTAAANGTSIKIIAGASLVFEGSMVPNTAINAISTGGTVTAAVLECS